MNGVFEKALYYLVSAVSAVVFFVGFTVAGFVMRLFSKSCRMNMNKSASSYWRVIRTAKKNT